MNDLLKRVLRLADRFETIATSVSDEFAGDEMTAATAEGGIVMKAMFESGIGFLDADFLTELFAQNVDHRDGTLREFTQSSWFVFLADRLSDHGNVLSQKVVSRSEGATCLSTNNNWRLRARNFSAFCHQLAAMIEAEPDPLPVGKRYQDQTWAICFEVNVRTIRNWRKKRGFPSAPCTVESVQSWANANNETMNKVPN
ncbi:hypothetical protein [Stieleria mannarensis]|uniref:hypothetical protein n=1 Tax=Stieleria mannarensis TaxID=2755585 RepID=UPI0016004A05|nr:hypothetical protein [Rhodopirellula sp. JC639]